MRVLDVEIREEEQLETAAQFRFLFLLDKRTEVEPQLLRRFFHVGFESVIVHLPKKIPFRSFLRAVK
jgi:hypothetical protein